MSSIRTTGTSRLRRASHFNKAGQFSMNVLASDWPGKTPGSQRRQSRRIGGLSTIRLVPPDEDWRLGTFGLAVLPLMPFPLPPPARFSSSIRKPELESRLLYTGHRVTSRQVRPRFSGSKRAACRLRCRFAKAAVITAAPDSTGVILVVDNDANLRGMVCVIPERRILRADR
jgi:hypothetical protein